MLPFTQLASPPCYLLKRRISRLVTSRFAIHDVSAQRRKAAVAELARVVAPGGGIILLELMGYAAGYEEALRHVRGWKNVEVSMESAEVLYDFGPCQILLARKPELQTVQ